MQAEGVALVTGAGRGLGRALALELAERGFEVVAAIRRVEAAADLPGRAADRGGRLRLERLDVTQPGSMRMPEGLRVLVNNAGAAPVYLPVEHADADVWRSLFETNVFGLLEVTRRAVPRLREAGGGVVCNITSSAALVPMPFYAAYRASKAAVAALGESLQAETARFGIRVLEILPGPIDTDMLDASDRPLPAERWPEYRELARRARDGRLSVRDQVTPAADAARAIADAILDDAAPLRVACDPLGAALLEGWRQTGNERWIDQFLRGLGANRDRTGPGSPRDR